MTIITALPIGDICVGSYNEFEFEIKKDISEPRAKDPKPKNQL